MNLKQLQLFHEIMVTGKISQAADRLSFSQPAAIKMLANFETTLGYQLFFRANGRLNPTAQASYLHRETLRVLNSVKRLEDSFDKARFGQFNKLTIASIFAPTHSFLPKILSHYYQQYPELKISIQVLSSSQICDGVASGQFELGFVDKSYNATRYESQEFILPCYCAIHKKHPAAHHAILTPALLENENWITLSPATQTYQALQASYQAAELNFNPRIEVNGSLNALAFVAEQCGVTLIDAISLQHVQASQTQHDIVFRPFRPIISESIQLISATNRPLSNAAVALKAEIIEQLKALLSS